jgi:FKBP-type peptidyl-prolyl cis-trans isomerase FklB
MNFLLALAPASPMLLAGAAPEGALSGIQVSFKMDPRLASGVYGGDRWVSPPTYRGAGAQDTVEIKAIGVDSTGHSVSINPDWIPSDPEMVSVTPSQSGQVRITVKRPGQSILRLVSQGVSKELAIKAENKGAGMQVEIAQPVEMPAPQAAPAVAKQNAETVAGPEAPKTVEQSGRLETIKDKFSYVLGANLGSGIRKQEVEVDPELVVQGLKDSLDGGPMLLTQHEVTVIMSVLQKELRKKQVTLAAEKIVADKALGEKNKQSGEAFLTENKTKEGVVALESGLQYKVLKQGDGKKPAADDTVVCNYRGTLLDGTEFDSSYRYNKPATFPINRVIKGWNQALQLMPAGSKWQLFVPPSLAYGDRGSNSGIGPNATLVFEVELVSIKDKSEANTATASLPLQPRSARAATPVAK